MLGLQSDGIAFPTEPSAIAVGDLNGDGKEDLVVTLEAANKIAVFLARP